MEKTLILMAGVPGSGKTTIAQTIVEGCYRDYSYALLSTDSFFIDVDEEGNEVYKWDPSKLAEYHGKNQGLAEEAMQADTEIVIIDNTNIKEEHARPYIYLARKYGYDVRTVTVDGNLDEIKGKSEHGVPHHKVKLMHRQMENLLNPYKNRPLAPLPKVEQNGSLPRCVICDLDGTAAIICDRSPYNPKDCDLKDMLNPAVAAVLNAMVAADYGVLFVSGREDAYRPETYRFIRKSFPWSEDEFKWNLLMRPTGDKREDSIVKQEIYENEIKGNYFVEFVIDDRDRVVDMWRRLGLHCFQCDYGCH